MIKYIKSPYLLFNKDHSISNFYTGKRFKFSDSNIRAYSLIKKLPREISMHHMQANGIDDQFLINNNFIFNNDINPLKLSFIRYASIEINSHCNSRCKFCPVLIYPRASRFMEDKLFRIIAAQLKDLPGLRWVSLNHYNEPLLHPKLSERILLLYENGLKVRLFTNGKNLKASFFTKNITDCIDKLVLNIPSINPASYLQYTGTRMPNGFKEDITRIINLEIPVEICINGNPRRATKEKELIDQYFKIDEKNHCHSYINITNDRSGMINNNHVIKKSKYTGQLGGCRRFFENISIGVEGKLFICCQDYFRKYSFKNVISQSIKNILLSDEYLNAKKKVCGILPADDDFICRYCNEVIRCD